MVAEPLRVHLDSDVVAGLVLDQIARDYVTDLRRNGGRMFLSPAVVYELAQAPAPIRERRLTWVLIG
jgi:hypothetical protein